MSTPGAKNLGMTGATRCQESRSQETGFTCAGGEKERKGRGEESWWSRAPFSKNDGILTGGESGISHRNGERKARETGRETGPELGGRTIWCQGVLDMINRQGGLTRVVKKKNNLS